MTAALVVVIVALLAERGWSQRSLNAERRRWQNAMIARTPYELAALDKATNGARPPRPAPSEPGTRHLPHGV